MRMNRHSTCTTRECLCTARLVTTLSTISCDAKRRRSPCGRRVCAVDQSAPADSWALPDLPGRAPFPAKGRGMPARHGVKLAPAKSGQPARRKRAGRREALRADHLASGSEEASKQSGNARDIVTKAAVGSWPDSNRSTAGLTQRSPHMCWVNPDIERKARDQGRATAHQK